MIGNIASYLAVFMWGATFGLVLLCGNIPTLLLVGVACLILGILSGIEELISGRGGIRSLQAPAGASLFEAFGWIGYRIMAWPAMLMVDPVEAANTVNVWIVGAIIFGLLRAGERLGVRHYLGLACFAGGLLVMGLDGIGMGHVLAFAGGMIWAWYVVQAPYVEGSGRQAGAIGGVAGGAALIVLSVITEKPWDIGAVDLFWLFWLVVVANAGFVLWRYGARHGEARKAKIGVLFAPVAAVLWIWVLGGADLTASGIAGVAAITAAGLIASPHVFKEGKKARHGGQADSL